MKVIDFTPPTPCTEGLVAALEAVLEQARRGEIESFGFGAVRRDRSILRAHGYSDDASKFALIGVLTHEARYVSQKIDDMNPVTDYLEE